jgi:hypothetical protein
MVETLANAINARELLPLSFLLSTHDYEMQLIAQKPWDSTTCVWALVQTLNQDEDVESPSFSKRCTDVPMSDWFFPKIQNDHHIIACGRVDFEKRSSLRSMS